MDKTGRMKLLEADTERENTHTYIIAKCRHGAGIPLSY